MEGVRYQFKSVLKAFDICFKTIYLFEFQFPQEGHMFYTFIESFFYNFKPTNNNYCKVHIIFDYLKEKEKSVLNVE